MPRMHRNPPRNQNLQRFTVRPGSETGLYYIPIANLSHRTTARQLRAFASQACEVDHVEVYTPTCGFVRVRGRANFERAFRFLDGGTLEFRALQADARNLDQPTIVFLPPTDYHAARILGGDEGRIFPEPDDPVTEAQASMEQLFLGGPGGDSSYTGYQGAVVPAPNTARQTDPQSVYVTSPSYPLGGGYQPAMPSAAVTASGPVAYQAALTSGYGLMRQAQTATVPQPTSQPAVYLAAQVAASTYSQPASAQYQYGDASYYTSEPTYGTGGQGYSRYLPASGSDSDSAYPSGYGQAWPSGTLQTAHTAQAEQYPSYAPPGPQPPVASEQRKILILNLRKDTLSEASVMDLLSRYAGLDLTPGQVQKVHLPVHRDGRLRGTASVTFATAELASAAVAALDGREVDGVRLETRLTEPAASGEGSGGGPRSSRSHRRPGGGGSGRGAARAASGTAPRSPRPSRTQPQTAAMASALDEAPSASGSVHTSGAASSSVTVEDPGLGTSGASGPGSDGAGDSSQTITEERPVVVAGSGGQRNKEPKPVVVNGRGRPFKCPRPDARG